MRPPGQSPSGVDDADIESSQGGRSILDDPGAGAGVAQVHDHSGSGADLGAGPVNSSPVAPGDHDLGALGDQSVSHRTTEAGGRAQHERAATSQPQIHVAPP